MVKIAFNPEDGKKRCKWCLKDQQYVDYHDNEWGVPSHDDHHLFEHLILETFQAGLSWHTILKKRENLRLAFDNFNPHKMASYTERDVEILMSNPGIIRYEAKIRAAINNAQRFLKVVDEFGTFDKYIWKFTDYKSFYIEVKDRQDYQSTIPESDAMSKDLKRRGFKFIGSTTCMAYMESMGMVKDHFTYCFKHKK